VPILHKILTTNQTPIGSYCTGDTHKCQKTAKTLIFHWESKQKKAQNLNIKNVSHNTFAVLLCDSSRRQIWNSDEC